MRCPSRWLLLLALAIGPVPASALDLSRVDTGGDPGIAMTGEIARGDADRLDRLRGALGRIAFVRIDSTGGDLHEAFDLGRLLRRHHLTAMVPDAAVCASACIYVLAGAQRRRVAPGGRVGVHMFASSHGRDVLAMIAQLVREHGQEGAAIVARRLEQRSAAMTLEVASYLDEMSISLELLIPTFATRPDEVRWLTRKEMRAFRLLGE